MQAYNVSFILNSSTDMMYWKNMQFLAHPQNFPTWKCTYSVVSSCRSRGEVVAQFVRNWIR